MSRSFLLLTVQCACQHYRMGNGLLWLGIVLAGLVAILVVAYVVIMSGKKGP
jgi:hypothetical protein